MLTWRLLKIVFEEDFRRNNTWDAIANEVVEDSRIFQPFILLVLVFPLRWAPTLWMLDHLKLVACSLAAMVAWWFWAFILSPEAPLPLAVALAVVCLYIVLAAGFLIFLGLFIFEVAVYLTFLATSFGVLFTLCGEAYLVYHGEPSVHTARAALVHARKLKRLAELEVKFASQQRKATPVLSVDEIAEYFSNPDTGAHYKEVVAFVRKTWHVLLRADLPVARRAHRLLLQKAQREIDWWNDTQAQTILLTAAEVLEESMTAKPGYGDRITFSSTVDELVGLLARILPFPSLKHLARPFSFQPFLPLLLTYPGLQYLVTNWPPWMQATPALFLHIRRLGAMLHGLGDQAVVSLIKEFLEAEQVDELATKAERLSHDAILDAVLAWKANKLVAESARRRHKDK
ncbi:hypothetical protein JCM10207_007420 [Rhodosporidiobolus poonsookiae]